MNIIRGKQKSYSTIGDRNPWLPGLQRIPILGTGALILSVASLLFSAIILALSNGKTLEAWDRAWAFSPTVYLSIASTIVNITLHYAFTVGIDIYWWRTALGPNTTISKLHRVWSHGNSFIESAKYLTSLNILSIACILVTLTPINGPLLQRASQVRARDFAVPHSLDLSIPSHLPVNYSAYLIGRGHSVWYTSDFSKIVRDYSNQVPLQINSSCDNCKSTILGAGLAVSCQSSYIPYNMSSSPIVLGNNTYQWHLAEIFQSGFSWSESLPSVILVGAQIKTGQECAGSLLQRNCTLAAATVEYPVRVTNSTITLDPDSTIWDDVIVGQLFNASTELAYTGTAGTTWAGMALALQNQYGSFLIVEYDPVVQYQLFFDGAAAHTYLNQSNGYPDCNMTFADPIDDMLSSARELAFRTAINIGATNSSYMRSFAATETRTSNIYESQYLFLALAAGLSILGILSVVVTFNGFWNMGRMVSLSPIETAKAFDAPLLRSHDSNASIEYLLREVGVRRVRYGVVSVGQTTIVEQGNFEYSNMPPKSAKYRDRVWGADGSASTKRGRQEPYREILADDEFEMQEPSIRSRYSASQYSQSSTKPFAPAQMDTEAVDDQGSALRLQISSAELVQPPTVGAQYIG